MLILKFISKLIKALHAGPSPGQISGGLTLGMILGLIPGVNFISVILILLALLININLSMLLAGLGLFSLIAMLLDPLFHTIGYYLLVEQSGLYSFWTALYNVPLVPLSKFNNTIALGSLVVSLMLSVPMFLLAKNGVAAYRETIEKKIKKLRIVKVITSSRLFAGYQKLSSGGSFDA